MKSDTFKPYTSTPISFGRLLLFSSITLAILLFILVLGILYIEYRDNTNRALDNQRRDHERKMDEIRNIRRR